MKIVKNGIFWKKIKYTNGRVAEGDDPFDTHYHYFLICRNTKMNWGYDCMPFDCQNHETFNLGPISLCWCRGSY